MTTNVPASVTLSEELSTLFIRHDIPKLLIPATPSRNVVCALIELHSYATHHMTQMIGNSKNTIERMLAMLEHPHPASARYFTMRNEFITLLTEERARRLPKARRPEDEISVYQRDRLVPIVEFDWSVSGSFSWVWNKLLNAVKRK